MWKALQQALLYISTQDKLPGLQTQRNKCELWPDQPFRNESICQIVWLGWSSVRDRSESSDTMLSDLVAPSSHALIASSKVKPLVWYTWKHGQAQRNLLHGAHRNLVFMPLGFLWHSVQMQCFHPCLRGYNFFWEVAFIEPLLWVHHQNPLCWVAECTITVSFFHQSQHNGRSELYVIQQVQISCQMGKLSTSFHTH